MPIYYFGVLIMIKYTNYGGAEGITGACHMISTDFGNVLLDCGLFQGKDKKNYSNFEMYFEPRNVDAVVLSHAHIDHCGRIPILYDMGYKGKVYGTEATKFLAEVILDEGLKIFDETSDYGYKLFSPENLKMFLNNFVIVNYRDKTEILENVFIELFDAGHLLGSASILLDVSGKTVFYSGDIGKLNTPILKDPEKISGADYAIIESTYGSLEKHESNQFFDDFKRIILDTLSNGGRCIIPSATVGKMQEILYLINDIFEENDLIYKVYIDSPMSSRIVDIYEKFRDLYDDEAKEKLNNGDNPLYFKNLRYSSTKEESIEIQEKDEPYIVLAAGSMCEGGRVVYHLRKQIDNFKNSIILIGNQVHGTLGYKLAKGDKQVKIFRDTFDVKAKIYNFPSLSGHGDRNAIIDYILSMDKKPKKLFLVHGDRKNQIDLSKNLDFNGIEYTEFYKTYELK